MGTHTGQEKSPNGQIGMIHGGERRGKVQFVSISCAHGIYLERWTIGLGQKDMPISLDDFLSASPRNENCRHSLRHPVQPVAKQSAASCWKIQRWEHWDVLEARFLTSNPQILNEERITNEFLVNPREIRNLIELHFSSSNYKFSKILISIIDNV